MRVSSEARSRGIGSPRAMPVGDPSILAPGDQVEALRILLLVQGYPPSLWSCATLMAYLAEDLVAAGHGVTVLAAEPKLRSGFSRGREGGVDVLRVRTGPFQGVSRIRRALSEWRLPGRLGRYASSVDRCDLIVTYSPSVFLGRVAARLKRRWRCSHYLVLRDLFPHWVAEAGLLRTGGLAHRFLLREEAALYRSADTIGVQAPGDLAHFDDPARRSIRASARLEVLYNWSPTSGLEVGPAEWRARLGLEGQTIFLSAGRLGVPQGARVWIRLAERLRSVSQAHFVFAGEGSELPALRAEARSLGLGNVSFVGSQPRPAFRSLVAEADVGLLGLRPELRNHNVPARLLEYCYHGLPILAALNPETDLRGLLEDSEAGLVSPYEDEGRLEAQARRLLGERSTRRRLGENGRRLLERRFSSGRAAAQIIGSVSSGAWPVEGCR